MALGRTEQLLETLEGAASEAQAAEALYALLQATRAVPITFAQRSRAEALLQGRLLPRGWLGPEHPLVKLLALRLSTHYLPGVSEFPLPPPPRPSPAAAAAKPSPATAPPAVEGDKPVAAATKQIPRGVSSSNGVVARSNNGDNGALSFLFQPLPRGTKALCIVTRSSTRLKPAVYRLYVEALVVGTSGGSGNGGSENLRQSLRAAGLDPRWVVGGGSTSASLSPREEAVADAGGGQLGGGRCCLLEARRLTAAPLPVAKVVQVAVYACAPSSAPAGATEAQPTKGQGGRGRSSSSNAAERTEEVGRLQSPAPGVLTATATAAAAAAASSPVGSRLCVQVCERKRLLSLSVALPVAAGRGNLTAAQSAAAAEGMEVPIAHLQALCGGSSGNGSSAVFGARSRPPRWSALDKLYTLDFENGARRVREPSRKNVSLLPADAAQLPSAAAAAHNPADHYHHRGGRGFTRAGGGAGTAVTQGAAAEEAGWGRESKQPRPVLQLGKMGEHTFSLDFRAPFSPFQALAVAVAAFEA